MVDLSAYVNKYVAATLRSGEIVCGTIIRNCSGYYPYSLNSQTYTEGGRHYVSETCGEDIVSLRVANPPDPEPSFAIKNTVCVARFGETILCAFPTRDQVKKYLQAEHSEIDPYDIAITTETLKGAA